MKRQEEKGMEVGGEPGEEAVRRAKRIEILIEKGEMQQRSS